MLYDATRGDVEVSGRLAWLDGRGAPVFRYTSVTCYGFDALPLPEYLDDETLAADGAGRYAVRLTTAPTRRPGANEIDVSGVPRGACVVRVVYPADDAVLAAAKPAIRPLF